MPKKQKLYLITLTSLTAVFAFAFYSYSAWNPPTADPTGNNAPSPLNVSGTGQIKVGGLTLNTGGAPNGLLVPNGNVGIGTTNPQAQLDVGFSNGSGIRLGSNTQMQAVSWHNSTVINNNLYYDGDGSVDDASNYRYISGAGSFNNAGAQLFIKGNGGEDGVRFQFRTTPVSTGANTAPASLNTRFAITSTHAQAFNNFYVDGNVGIGVTNPKERLHVQGIFRSGGGDGMFNVEARNSTFGSETLALQTTIDNRRISDGYVGGEDRYVLALQPDFGRVGIGTTSPQRKLHVQDGSTQYIAGGDSLTLQTVNGDSEFPYIEWRDRNGTRGMYLGWGSLGNHLELRTENGNNLGIMGGNVGIGTTSPGAKLDVIGNIRSKDGSDFVQLSAHDSSNLSQIRWGDDTNDRFRFYFDHWNGTGNDREVLTLRSSGNVGISNSNPSYKLHVAGDIYANGGWVRVSGNQGIYFQSYGGGWYMTDTSWIRAYANKNILTGGQMRASTLYATNQVCIRGACRTGWPSSDNRWNGNNNTTSHIWRPGSVDIDNSLWANFITSEGGALIRGALRGDGCNMPGGNPSASNCLHIGTGLGGFEVRVRDDLWVDDKIETNSSGSVTSGAFFYSSDESLKENIQPLENSLSKVLQLNGVSYKWKESGAYDAGLIAQDVEEVFPELVTTNEQGLKSLDYGRLTAPLIEAIKEQQKQIDDLQKQIDELKAQINSN